eukprot:XP_011423136.1 PREDICTED: THAP domain-containing protein 2-like [Crassostrea gigas]
MVLCAAPNCDIRYGQGVSMFSFPDDPKLCQIWVRKLKTVNYWPSKHSKLCERHFTPDSFIFEPRKARSIGYTRLQLKKDATPSIFDNTPINVKGQKRKTSEASPCLPKQCRSSKALEKRRAPDSQELDSDVEIILPPPCQFQDSVSEETSTEDGEV